MTTVVSRMLIFAFLVTQAWLGCVRGQLLCIPVSVCEDHRPSQQDHHESCDHDHHGCPGHDHDHGPFTPVDHTHDHDDCGCHVHLFEPYPEDVTAPVLTQCLKAWATAIESRPLLMHEVSDRASRAISAPPRPPNTECLDQVLGVRSTRLMI